MRSPSPGIVASGRRSFLLASLSAALLLAVALLGWYRADVVDGPRLERGVMFARAVTDSHEAMLDQETGLRGYQITGDSRHLQPYRTGQQAYLRANGQAWHLVTDERLQALLRTTEQRAVAWQTEHAVPELARTAPGRPVRDELAAAGGKALFDAYRASYRDLLREARAVNTRSLQDGRRHAWTVNAVQVVLALLALVYAGYRRRVLQRELVRPVAEITAVLHRLADGDSRARPRSYAAPELDELAAGVGALAEAAEQRGLDAVAQREAVAGRAAVFQAVLGVAHELSGHLERRDLVRALLREVAQTARVEQAAVHAVVQGQPGDSLGTRGEPLEVDDVARDAVRQLRVVLDEDGCGAALPLGHGGAVHAVLQVRAAAPLDEEQVLALRSLALAAGGALTAAELHETVRAESRRDVLTGLYNRRRFEEDLEHELALVGRLGVPASLVLLDIDHFKQFNDAHGHREGDRLLHEVGGVLTSSLRSTDSAYRYGGEELAVLLRGASPSEAEDLAERLRGTVELRTAVTVSVGVVTATADVGPDAAVEAADQALYAAKQGGRNRVCQGRLDPAQPGVLPVLPAPRASSSVPSSRQTPPISSPSSTAVTAT